MSELPLFTLPETVVFPGMTVPLHVFEERYKTLIRFCLEAPERRFVATLAADGGGIRDDRPPLPEHGTFMDILSFSEGADGTYELLTHGQERCRLQIVREELVAEPDGSRKPLYFVADDPAPLQRGDPNQERLAAWDALETFRAYAKTFFAFNASEQIEQALPEDLLYQASFVCANIRVPSASRQVLLDAPDLIGRFQLASKLMQERLDAHRPAREA